MIDMSIVIKDAQYFRKRKAFEELQTQANRTDQIDKKLKNILKSDISKIQSESTPSQIQLISQNQHSNAHLFSQKFFQGKLYTAWIFIIKKLPVKTFIKFRQMQTQLQSDKISSIIPFSPTFEGSQIFFEAPQTYFKILIDLQNAEILADYLSKQYNKKLLNKISEIHIYSDISDGISRYEKLKAKIPNKKKVKQLFYDIDCKLDDIGSYLLNCRRFLYEDGQIRAQIKGYRHSNMFPAYMKLSDEDKTQVTKYRLNLYKLINLRDKIEIEQAQNIFIKFIQRVYQSNSVQLNFLQQEFIEAKNNGNYDPLKLYSKETFFYQVINTMLRVSHQVEDFKLIAAPFTEIYQAIKSSYQNEKQTYRQKYQNGFSLYRGAVFNINKIKVGQYIQLLGFVSTSKNKKVAQCFSNGRCLLEIRIPPQIFKLNRNQDHGFVDLNSEKLNIKLDHPDEQQFLINALNILKIIEITPKNEQTQYDFIVLQYGAIFALEQRKKIKPFKLSLSEKQVLTNFQYCTEQMTEIKDEIDLLIVTQQYDQATKKLQRKIYSDKQQTEELLIKYAQVLYQTGQKTRSSIIARKILSKFLQIPQKQQDKQRQDDKFEKHAEKVTEIFKTDEDNVSAKKVILKQIQNLNKNLDNKQNIVQKAFKLYQIGQINFEQGKFKESEEMIQKSLQILSESEYPNFSEETKQRSLKLRLNIIIFLLKICNQIGDEVNIKKWFIEGKKVEGMYEYYVKKNTEKQNDFKQIKLRLYKYSFNQNDSSTAQKQLEQVIENLEKENPTNQKFADLTAQLTINKAQKLVKNISQLNDFQQTQQNNSQNLININDETLFKNKTKQVEQSFQKCIKINSYRQGNDHPKVLDLRNTYGEFQYLSGNITKSKEQSNIVIEALKYKDTKIKSKAVLILSKDYFCTGQILKSFQTVKIAIKILQKAIFKQQNNQQYKEEFLLNQIYVQSNILLIKLYNKQLKHDMALKTIEEIQIIVKKKLSDVKSVTYSANLLQEKGNTYALKHLSEEKGNVYGLKQKLKSAFTFFNQAILLRCQQGGRQKIVNAISYCAIARYHLIILNLTEASKTISQAETIFSKFPLNSPNNWILSFVKSYFYKESNESQRQKQSIIRASQSVQKRFGPDHISYLTVKIRQAKILLKSASKQQEYDIIKQKLSFLVDFLKNDPSIKQIAWENPKIENQKVGIKQQADKFLTLTNSKLSSSIKNSIIRSNSEIEQGMRKKTSLYLYSDSQLPNANPLKQKSQQTMAESPHLQSSTSI